MCSLIIVALFTVRILFCEPTSKKDKVNFFAVLICSPFVWCVRTFGGRSVLQSAACASAGKGGFGLVLRLGGWKSELYIKITIKR